MTICFLWGLVDERLQVCKCFLKTYEAIDPEKSVLFSVGKWKQSAGSALSTFLGGVATKKKLHFSRSGSRC